MKEFFMQALGAITILLMTGSVLYTWVRINSELRQNKKNTRPTYNR